MSWRYLFLVCVFALGIVALVIWRLADHDLAHHSVEPFDFTVDETSLSGTLWYPNGALRAVVAFVHGDGAQDRTANGGYVPLINTFLDAGIAVLSWDKPGVGGSGGNWLDQSMSDRATEVREALRKLRSSHTGIPIGAVGFSQAGWVLPRLTNAETDFIVLVGPAVSWHDQGIYYTRQRLLNEGLELSEITKEIARQQQIDAILFAPNATYDPQLATDNLSQDRWGFVKRNMEADATRYLQLLDVPLLAVWGQDDLNVDVAQNAVRYQEYVAGRNASNKIIVVPYATHGLLKSGPYNFQRPDQWGIWAKTRFLAEGRYAFAPGSLDLIMDWILARQRSSQ